MQNSAGWQQCGKRTPWMIEVRPIGVRQVQKENRRVYQKKAIPKWNGLFAREFALMKESDHHVSIRNCILLVQDRESELTKATEEMLEVQPVI